MKKYRLTVYIILTISLVLSGCRSNKITGIEIKQKVDLPDNIFISVPHISQKDNYSCATTSVAMAISAYKSLYKDPLNKEESWLISKSNKFKVRNFGNDVSALQRLVKFHGFAGEFVNQIGIYNLKYLLANNILIVLFIRPDLSKKGTHAILVIGYDDTKQKIFIEDPSNRLTEMNFKDLEKHWMAFLSKPILSSKQAGFIIYPKKK